MVYVSLKTNPQKDSFLLSTSNYAYNHTTTTQNNNQPRKLSIIGSDSYKRSLRRAFSRAKSIAFFNPDLTHFVTLTYKRNLQEPKQTIQDIKNLVKYQIKHCNRQEKSKFKYIYVMETQKRGAIHVHMICNDWLDTEWVGTHLNVKGWSHGFSDVLTIKNFDNDFKPYLYLFKYMSKAQRVGKSFIHVSRNFDKIEDVRYDEYIDKLIEDNLFYKEDYYFTLQEKTCTITKEYFRKKAEKS